MWENHNLDFLGGFACVTSTGNPPVLFCIIIFILFLFLYFYCGGVEGQCFYIILVVSYYFIVVICIVYSIVVCVVL